jgi:hypothetical protein
MSAVSDELAEAERRFRSFLDKGCDCNHFPGDEMGRVMAEFDRLRAVEKAAAAYVHTDAGDPQIADRYAELEALIRAGEQP